MTKPILGTLTTVKIIRVVQTDISNDEKYASPDGADLDLWCDVCDQKGIMMASDHVWCVEIPHQITFHVCSLNCVEEYLKDLGV